MLAYVVVQGAPSPQTAALLKDRHALPALAVPALAHTPPMPKCCPAGRPLSTRSRSSSTATPSTRPTAFSPRAAEEDDEGGDDKDDDEDDGDADDDANGAEALLEGSPNGGECPWESRDCAVVGDGSSSDSSNCSLEDWALPRRGDGTRPSLISGEMGRSSSMSGSTRHTNDTPPDSTGGEACASQCRSPPGLLL